MKPVYNGPLAHMQVGTIGTIRPSIQNNNSPGNIIDNRTNYKHIEQFGPRMQHCGIPGMVGGVSTSTSVSAVWGTDAVSTPVRGNEGLPVRVREGGKVENHWEYPSLPNRHFPNKVKQLRKNENAFRLQQKINILQKQLNDKNLGLKSLSKEVDELKDKSFELIKGNKHLVEVIKNKNIELDSNKVEMSNMKSEVKSAQKEVLNCLKEKMGHVLPSNSAKIEKAKVDKGVQTNNNDTGETSEDNIAFENDSRLCKEIRSFLEFHCLSEKIGESIELALNSEDELVSTKWDVSKKEVETAVSTFHGNVVMLLDEVTTVLKKKKEMEKCLSQVERNIRHKQRKIKKLTSEVKGMQKNVKKTFGKDKETSGKVLALLTELKSTENDLLLLKKTQTKLETETKKIENKINLLANSL